jgi:predicted enzyme related to lactoylglutathione lyase
MADQTARGRFLWHDLYTSDPAAAHQFYGKAVGWKSQPFDADPSYLMFAGPKGPLGGAGKLPEGQPHWVAYVGTANIADSVLKAKSLGATVVTDVTAIPNGGSYAVLKDPQGAVFGMYQYASDPGAGSAPQRGEISWYELGTNDADSALKFYSALFGWTEVAKHDMGPDGFYHLFGWSGAQNGGLFKKPAQWGPPAWTIYVRVKDMDSTVKKAKAAGATLINGPMEVPGGDWIAQFTDPQGAVFAVHVLKADLKPAAAKPAEAAAAAPAKVEAPKAAAPKAAAPKAKKPAAAKKKAAAKTQVSSKKSAKKPAKKAAKKVGKKKVVAKAKKSVKKAAKKKASSRSTRGAKKKARKAK